MRTRNAAHLGGVFICAYASKIYSMVYLSQPAEAYPLRVQGWYVLSAAGG